QRPPRFALFPYTTLFRSIVLLDTDQDPFNDLDLRGPDAESVLLAACGAGAFPRQVGGVIVVSCAKDTDCVDLGTQSVVTPLALRSEEHTSELQSRENIVC